jgi:cobalt/nickel transport system permease protein
MSRGGASDVGRMDELGRLASPIHRLDARAKILATAAFVLTVMSFPQREISALTPLVLFPLVTGALAGLPAGYLARKLLIASPFALAVGIFNPFFDREPALALGGIAISGGWLSFTSIVLRFVLTAGAALVLVAATGIHPLCRGLEKLGMPRVFGVQLLFLYRYLFTVANEGLRLSRAVSVRAGTARGVPPAVYGPLLGQWLLRSIDRATRIHIAMRARGFDGQVRTLDNSRFGWRECAFLTVWLVFFAAARHWNLAAAAGRLLAPAAP